MKNHMLSGPYWVLAMFVLLGFANYGSALKCWQCSSDMSPECGDPMNNTDHHKLFHTRECEATMSSYPYSQEKMVCRKTVQRVHGQRIVSRSCSTMTPQEMDKGDGKCSSSTTGGRVSVESCDICTTDLCNGATSTTGLSLFAVSAIALVLCYFKL